ncbi:MAG: TraB/GumN family protein [Gammaproteobacteria bacterium]
MNWKNARGLATPALTSFGVAVAVFALPGCGGEDKMTAEAPCAVQILETAPAPGPALWKVSDDDTTVYLFGTFHALKPEVSWFEGPVRAAYEAADEVALEATDTQDQQRMEALVLKYGVDPQRRKLSEVIGEENAAALSERLASLNLSLGQVERMEPWLAVTSLAQQQMQAAGFNASYGVDAKLQNSASEAGKTLTGIEGAEAQLALLDSFSEENQILWLELTLRDWDKAGETLNNMLALWSSGDMAGFATEMFESIDEVPTLTEALLTDRNEGFADWIIERMAQPGTVFFAVGAGHLAGVGSVQDFLCERGLYAQRQ